MLDGMSLNRRMQLEIQENNQQGILSTHTRISPNGRKH